MERDTLYDLLNRFESACGEQPESPDGDTRAVDAFIPELTGPTLTREQRVIVRQSCEKLYEENLEKPSVLAAIATIVSQNIRAAA